MWEGYEKGKALIIANRDFTGLTPRPPTRPWAQMDVNNMTTLLERLGYSFQKEQNRQHKHGNLSAQVCYHKKICTSQRFS